MLTAADHEHIQKVAADSGHASKMTLHAVEHARLNVAQACQVFDTINADTVGKTSEILMRITPLLRNPDDARVLFHHVTGGDRMQVRLRLASMQALSGLSLSRSYLAATLAPIYAHIEPLYRPYPHTHSL